MFDITDNIIKITRGDTAIINLTIYDQDDNTYTPTENDHIYFTVKPDINNEYYSFKKEFTNSSVELTKEDTIIFNFGKYFFDVRLENNTNIDTVIVEGKFIIERGTANAS